MYRVAHEKPARRLVDQRGRRSAVSVLRIDTAELHRVYDNMLQREQNCIDEQGDHFQHLL